LGFAGVGPTWFGRSGFVLKKSSGFQESGLTYYKYVDDITSRINFLKQK